MHRSQIPIAVNLQISGNWYEGYRKDTRHEIHYSFKLLYYPLLCFVFTSPPLNLEKIDGTGKQAAAWVA